MDLDYHSEPSLEKQPSQQPIFHFHKWSSKGVRLKPIPATLSEPFIDGKTFWELEPDLEWTDGPAHF